MNFENNFLSFQSLKLFYNLDHYQNDEFNFTFLYLTNQSIPDPLTLAQY